MIGPGDPPPYEVLNPDGASSVLLICDHASPAIPAAMNDLGLDADALGRHIAFDSGAAAVTRSLSRRLDAPAVLAGYSRLLIDMNRQPGDPESIPDRQRRHRPFPRNQELSEDGRGRGVSRTFFWPYHHAITNGHGASVAARHGPASFAVGAQFHARLSTARRPAGGTSGCCGTATRGWPCLCSMC